METGRKSTHKLLLCGLLGFTNADTGRIWLPRDIPAESTCNEASYNNASKTVYCVYTAFSALCLVFPLRLYISSCPNGLELSSSRLVPPAIILDFRSIPSTSNRSRRCCNHCVSLSIWHLTRPERNPIRSSETPIHRSSRRSSPQWDKVLRFHQVGLSTETVSTSDRLMPVIVRSAKYSLPAHSLPMRLGRMYTTSLI
jgi:hypothetical protein